MKALVVYDSIHGNTEKIALSIAEGLGEEAQVIKAADVKAGNLDSVAILVAGSPTYGGQPTPAMKAFLTMVKNLSLNGVAVAAFDTRMPQTWVKIFTFAAPKILKALASRGGDHAVKSEGFFVAGREGPLLENEEQRAVGWGKAILANAGK